MSKRATPLFRRTVEIGRIVRINAGKDKGKIATIIDIIDHNKALIDGPSTITGVTRQAINFRYLTLTSMKVKIQRSARLGTLQKAFTEAKILDKWNNGVVAKRQAAATKRANLNDFDRFKVSILKKKTSAALRTAVTAARRQHNKGTKDQSKIIGRDISF